MSMTRDDIFRMAREAGYFLYDLTAFHGVKTVETDEDDQWAQLERFAALVAAAEREACAKLCYELPWKDMGHTPSNLTFAAAIRARGGKE